MENDPFNATLVERVDLTDVLSVVKVRPDSGEVPPFTPGQFVRLGLPKAINGEGTLTARGRVRMTRRAYSIASAPFEKEALEFFVVRVDEGALTPQLWDIPVGGRVWMDDAAKGEFTIDVAPPGKDLVMVSTGTGIAPFISMLRTYRGQGRWRRFVLINGSRFAADLGYREELQRVMAEDSTVCYIPLATREPPESAWPELRGRVQMVLEPERYEKLVGAPLTPEECHVFLCGNPAMIDEVQGALEARGFVTDERERVGTIHFERYW